MHCLFKLAENKLLRLKNLLEQGVDDLAGYRRINRRASR